MVAFVIGRSRALAAGVTWTCVVASAPWAARLGHTSVVDAAGAIYVLGGEGRSVLDDVWASATEGARPDSRRGTRRVLQGCYWYSTSSHGCSAVLGGCLDILRGTIGVLFALCWYLRIARVLGGYLRALKGYSRGYSRGVPRGAQGRIQVVLRGTHAATQALEGHSIGAQGVLRGYSWHGMACIRGTLG